MEPKKKTLKEKITQGDAVVKENKKSETTTTSPWKSGNTIAILGGRPSSTVNCPSLGSSNTLALKVTTRKTVICAPQQQALATASSHVSQGSSIGMRNMPTDRIQDPRTFEKGVVLCLPTHTHHYDQRACSITSTSQSMSSIGVVNSKYRKYIVVGSYTNHAVGLPIHTYQGNGLANKDSKSKAEHISVRDSEHRKKGVVAATSHGVLYSKLDPKLCDRTIPFHRMTDQTVCKYTEPYCISFSTKCTIFGRLEIESTDLLQKLFRDSVNRSVDPNKTPTRETFRTGYGNPVSGGAQLFSANHNIGGSSIAGGRSMR